MSEGDVARKFLREVFVELKKSLSKKEFEELVRDLTADEPACAECAVAENKGEIHRDARKDAPVNSAYQG